MKDIDWGKYDAALVKAASEIEVNRLDGQRTSRYIIGTKKFGLQNSLILKAKH